MNIMRALTYYFIADDPDDVHVSDKIWFFGFYVVAFAIMFIMLIATMG